jgi:transcriptional regulator with XRE-family HTH domain
MMLGGELRAWRKRNGYTQEMLCMALNLGSRQTIISWEKSNNPIARTVELALIALEHLPEKCKTVAGTRCSVAEYREGRKQAKRGSDLSLKSRAVHS